ncbi:HEAT repeat domain-containing protein [Streptomyces sp. SBC-4]|nr:HEAT repeat domain-containing protein [Streptomyces sp. SBC-4]MDV5143170.1 HEAT repeat domain-containing protein [Streptomyces sp. SBC-4]
MINDLDSIDWASLGHAYGPADDVPGWLRGMVSPDPEIRKDAFGNFYGKVLHQGSVYSSTVASVPFLFAMADDPATPDRAEFVALLLTIGREAVDAEEVYAVICGNDGEDSTIYPDTASLMREHADAFVAYAVDSDPQVRRAAIEGLGLFLDDAERAVALLRNRLTQENGVTERLLVVRTMADLALRLPVAAVPARAWFDALADSGSTDPDTRLAALAHRARCAPDSIDDQTVPAVIALLRQVTPAPRPEQDQARGSRESSPLCTCEAEPEPDPGVPGHIAAAFDDLERHGRVHAPTTPLLTALHEALDARFVDRKELLTEQLRSPDRATRYDAIDMARRLITSWRGDHTHLVRLIGDCLLPGDSFTAAAAAEALGSLSSLAEPAREALATYVTTHLTEHRPDVWASPHRALRRAHQQAVVALAGLGDERALPSLLVALDTGTDAWRAVDAAGRLPQAAAELAPRLIRRFATIDYARERPGFGFTSFTIALSRLGDPAAVPALTDALRAAVQHKQWHIAEAVLKALAAFGLRAVSALDEARPLTKADNVALRTAAVSALWELERRPEEVVPLLNGLLEQHRNTDAIDLAGRIGPAAAPVLPRLRQILDEQLAQNAHNEQNGSTALNDWWTLIHVASALWDIDGTSQTDTVLPVLLDAWKNNDASAHAVIACLDRMGPAAHPALPQIQAALAQPHRYDQRWIGAVTLDLEIERTCRTILARLQDLPEPSPAGQE